MPLLVTKPSAISVLSPSQQSWKIYCNHQTIWHVHDFTILAILLITENVFHCGLDCTT